MTDDFEAIPPLRQFAIDSIQKASWCHVVVGASTQDVVTAFSELGMVTQTVHGARMKVLTDLYAEFASVWKFGTYDGPSYGAFFRDSLLDLRDGWPTTTGFAIVISDPNAVLDEEVCEYPGFNPLSGLENTLSNVAENFEEGIEGEPDDPDALDPMSFNVILVTDEHHRGETVRRWTEAGAPLTGVLP